MVSDVRKEDAAPPTASTAQPAASDPLSPPSIKPRGSILKMILVLLGLAAMIAFLVVFLTVVYFLFLR
jgi:hypothetical protein